MTKIKEVHGREILDSRGNPTVEVDVILESGQVGRMMVPSGASTGKFEALELRDGEKRFRGKGVTKAVNHVNTEIKKVLIGKNAEEQEHIDGLLIELDGTVNKSKLGANSILGASFAVAHAAAISAGKPLYKYLAEKYLPASEKLSVPVPMVNIISGGLHAGKNIDLQDFLVIPVSARSYPDALEIISAIYWKTQEVLNKKGYNAYLLADEGGFGPHLSSNLEALEILCEVFHLCGYKANKDVAIALDVASSHFYDPVYSLNIREPVFFYFKFSQRLFHHPAIVLQHDFPNTAGNSTAQILHCWFIRLIGNTYIDKVFSYFFQGIQFHFSTSNISVYQIRSGFIQ